MGPKKMASQARCPILSYPVPPMDRTEMVISQLLIKIHRAVMSSSYERSLQVLSGLYNLVDVATFP